jgi:hypothetical protein
VLGVDTYRCTPTQVSVVLSQGQETQANTSGVKWTGPSVHIYLGFTLLSSRLLVVRLNSSPKKWSRKVTLNLIPNNLSSDFKSSWRSSRRLWSYIFITNIFLVSLFPCNSLELTTLLVEGLQYIQYIYADINHSTPTARLIQYPALSIFPQPAELSLIIAPPPPPIWYSCPWTDPFQ